VAYADDMSAVCDKFHGVWVVALEGIFSVVRVLRQRRVLGRDAQHARAIVPPCLKHPASRAVLAYTLIEVLLAIGILGLVMTAIYASWDAVLRASRIGNTAADEVQRMRITRQALEQSLASAVLYAGNPRYYSFTADTADEKFAALSFVAHLPENFPGSGMFPNQPLRRVTFAAVPGTNNGLPSLVLRQSSLLTPTNSPIEESYTLTLSRQLSLFGIEFWSTNLNDWDVEWLSTNQLPKMMRVTLGFGGDARAGKPPAILVSSVISPGGQGVMRELQNPQALSGGGGVPQLNVPIPSRLPIPTPGSGGSTPPPFNRPR